MLRRTFPHPPNMTDTPSNPTANPLTPLSRQQHGQLRWRGPADYGFARHDQLCPLVLQELPKAALALPIGFVAQQEQFLPVAIQGLQAGRNLYVAPDGRWLAGYIPAPYRSYPFRLARTEDGQQVLCIHADSGLVGPGDGQPFFDEQGQLSPATAQVLQFFQQLEANRQHTTAACALLQQHGLIQPWPLRLQTDAGTQELGGLLRIDEAALNRLSGPALEALQRGGALQLAYCQLLSMQHLASLGRLATLHAQARQAPPPAPASARDLDLEFLNQGGTLRLGAL